MKNKRRKQKVSFFKRLLGDYDDNDRNESKDYEVEDDFLEYENEDQAMQENDYGADREEEKKPVQIKELSIDLKDEGDLICIKAAVPGVSNKDIDITLQREMITISTNEQSIYSDGDVDGEYFYRELQVGKFSRTVMLPDEVDVEGAKAKIKNGILIVRLPKLDKKREIRLEVDD